MAFQISIFVFIVGYFVYRHYFGGDSLFSFLDKYTLGYDIGYDMKFCWLSVTAINLVLFSSSILNVFDKLTVSLTDAPKNNVVFKILSLIVLFAFAIAFATILKSFLLFLFDNEIYNEIGFSIQTIIDEKSFFLKEDCFIYYFAVIDILLFFLLLLHKNKEKWEMLWYFIFDFVIIILLTNTLILPFITTDTGKFALSLFLLQFGYLGISIYFFVKKIQAEK
jgi:hypothetical protein